MPPEALFLHSLRCPKPLDLTPLLGSFSSYKNTLELPIEPELNNGDECSEIEGFSMLEKSLGLLPSDVCAIKTEIGGWRDYPSFYYFSVLCSILGSEAVETKLQKQKFLVLSWLASQLGVLYGEGNWKFFALDMLKQCIEVSASRIMLFRSPESSGVLKDLDEDLKIGKALDTSLVISVSRVAAAVAALYERSILEGKMRAIRYAQPLTRYQRMAELGAMTTKADEERTGRPNYRPIIDHDGLPRQRLSNQNG
ncbi:hypothetical protein F2Q70_00009576 [Brassica cretica]|uniref:Uncharacterized protein n=1 Tax=Brassica cretica TaxID=69181 RepID=A0A8S9LXQ3_BRACR|nr:hypothetical protein F2Q70_00009576 [Brassica cretica]